MANRAKDEAAQQNETTLLQNDAAPDDSAASE